MTTIPIYFTIAGLWTVSCRMTLDQLKPGQSAVITAISGTGPLAQRLMALGLLEGTDVAMLRRALGGDPLEIDVMGYALSLRRSEARQITIKLNTC